MNPFDWNRNGKRDIYDRIIERMIIEDVNSEDDDIYVSRRRSKSSKTASSGTPFQGKVIYDSTKDSNGVVILKSFLACLLCFGGIALPVVTGMEGIGVVVCIFGGIGLSLLLLKNT